MPLTNGNVTSHAVPLLRDRSIIDYHQAEEVLRDEYRVKDGLDVETLLDSTNNGALTYNDFLVLPGHIGTWPALRIDLV